MEKKETKYFFFILYDLQLFDEGRLEKVALGFSASNKGMDEFFWPLNVVTFRW